MAEHPPESGSDAGNEAEGSGTDTADASADKVEQSAITKT